MSTANFIEADGTAHAVDVPDGENLKQAAIDNLVPGIIGDCGGFAECGTCHGYVDEAYVDRLPAPSEDERLMLEGILAPVEANSRLTCQIPMTPQLDGIVVRLPEVQH
ncbi:2Fe-2S ferredoxin [Nocardioides zeae]|uniref:2Fe-2S ferredoxin n=1 Tax=Nocardioides zeae TaxID=1457234 RepID=A0ACC6IED2_9ACTN|nr:2Fe-2S iron-sulfur cluster-binding protein [Nocardioides zeae]MDR6174171.1 2Fe-2S ferredoxin [Nocardioides zeae]MDR6208978.1 2Fe-2S ferredoxin [Nocardioides zeae]